MYTLFSRVKQTGIHMLFLTVVALLCVNSTGCGSSHDSTPTPTPSPSASVASVVFNFDLAKAKAVGTDVKTYSFYAEKPGGYVLASDEDVAKVAQYTFSCPLDTESIVVRYQDAKDETVAYSAIDVKGKLSGSTPLVVKDAEMITPAELASKFVDVDVRSDSTRFVMGIGETISYRAVAYFNIAKEGEASHVISTNVTSECDWEEMDTDGYHSTIAEQVSSGSSDEVTFKGIKEGKGGVYVDYKVGEKLYSAYAPCNVTDSPVKGIRVICVHEGDPDKSGVLYKPDVDISGECQHDFTTVADYENGWTIDVSNAVNVTVAPNKAIEAVYDPTRLDHPNQAREFCWYLQLNDITTEPVDVKSTLTETMADGTTKDFVAQVAVSVISAKTSLFAWDDGGNDYVDGDVIDIVKGDEGVIIKVRAQYTPDNVAYETIDRWFDNSTVSVDSSDTSKITAEMNNDTYDAVYHVLKGLQVSNDAVITVKCGTVSMKLTGNVVSSI